MTRDFKGIWIPAELWLNENLTPNEIILLAEIDSLSSKNEGCYASNGYLAKFLKLEEGTVKNMLTELRKKKYIVDHNYDPQTGRRTMRCVFKCINTGHPEMTGGSFKNDGGGHPEMTHIYKEDKKEIDKEITSLPPDGGLFPLEKPLEGEKPLNEAVRKGSNKKTNVSQATQAEVVEFQKFWDSYGVKEDRKACLLKWINLPQKERDEILIIVEEWIADRKASKITIRYPEVFLNNENWKDDKWQDFIKRQQQPAATPAPLQPLAPGSGSSTPDVDYSNVHDWLHAESEEYFEFMYHFRKHLWFGPVAPTESEFLSLLDDKSLIELQQASGRQGGNRSAEERAFHAAGKYEPGRHIVFTEKTRLLKNTVEYDLDLGRQAKAYERSLPLIEAIRAKLKPRQYLLEDVKVRV